jgi:hypothetical protein
VPEPRTGPDRAVSGRPGSAGDRRPATLTVAARFNGPPGSGNGGWTAGALADRMASGPDDVVEVRLSSPPPLDLPLALSTDPDGTLHARYEQVAVARARRVPSPPVGPVPEPVDWARALAAEEHYAGAEDHPFPGCFACGPQRADGLGLRPGPVDGRDGTVVTTWVPDPSLRHDPAGLAQADPSLRPDPSLRHDPAAGTPPDVTTLAACWAALDCPGGWSTDLVGRPMVLGTITARVRTRPLIGARHLVVGRFLRSSGRKSWTESALYALPGPPSSAEVPTLVARALHLWITLPG